MMPHLPVFLLLLFLHAASGTEIKGYACMDMQGNSILVSRDNVYLLDKSWADCQVQPGSAVQVEADQKERLLKNTIVRNVYPIEQSTEIYTDELLLSGKLSYLAPKTPTITLDIPVGEGRSICLDFCDKRSEWLKAAAIAKEDLTTEAKIKVVIVAPKPDVEKNKPTENQEAPISLKGVYDSGIFQRRGYEMLYAGRAYIHLTDRAKHPADAPAFRLCVGDPFTVLTELQLELDGFSVRELQANEYDPSMRSYRGLMITRPSDGNSCIVYLTETGKTAALFSIRKEQPNQAYVQEITL